MRRPRTSDPTGQIAGVFCAACKAVRNIQEVESHTAATRFSLTCGHRVILLAGAFCGLDVQRDSITVYPNRKNLPTRSELT